MRNTFIRSIPFLLAFSAGLAVFLTAMFVLEDGNLYDIFIEISGALLGVPIVFLIYDYTEYLITRKLNKTLFSGIKFGVNSVIEQAMQTIKIQKSTDANSAVRKSFKELNARLVNLIYHGSNAQILNHDTLQNIMLMAKELGILATLKNKAQIAQHLKLLQIQIDNWNDLFAPEQELG